MNYTPPNTDNNVSQPSQKPSIISRIDWTVTLFLVLNATFALIASPIYFYKTDHVIWPLLAFTLVFAAATNLSITAGYHRLFAHRSYEAHPLLKTLYLLVGASAFQASALKWSADHRRHHTFEDGHNDPYSINKGFWYAHMGWLFMRDSTDHNPKAPDLQKDWMIRFQHRYYNQIAILMGFGFPTLVGFALGSAAGGFIMAGALRIALTQQSTFFVNSLCHTFGKKPYCQQITAKDSLWVAVLTHGEGYHNFHHKFQLDYRNGIRWYQWDPTKWTIWSLSLLGLTGKLKRISQVEILKAQLQVQQMRLIQKGFCETQLNTLKENIVHAQSRFRKLKADYELAHREWKQELRDKSQERILLLKKDMELARLELHFSLKQWKMYLRST